MREIRDEREQVTHRLLTTQENAATTHGHLEQEKNTGGLLVCPWLYLMKKKIFFFFKKQKIEQKKINVKKHQALHVSTLHMQ